MQKIQTCFGCCKTMYGDTILWNIPDFILLGILQECAKTEMEWVPGLVDVLKRKINCKKHSESCFSLRVPLLCWSVSASKQRKDPSREVQHNWAFPLPLMGNFISTALLLVIVWWFHRWSIPSWGMGSVCWHVPHKQNWRKKKSEKTNYHQISCGNYFEH